MKDKVSKTSIKIQSSVVSVITPGLIQICSQASDCVLTLKFVGFCFVVVVVFLFLFFLGGGGGVGAVSKTALTLVNPTRAIPG